MLHRQKILNYFFISLVAFYLIKQKFIDNNERFDYEAKKIRKAPLIFVGGFERSGTTLMRAILDVHDKVSCGPETKVIPYTVHMLKSFLSKKRNRLEIESSKIPYDTIDDAVAKFVYHIMDNHIRRAPRLCAKDPKTFMSMDYLHKLFPNAKFVYMVRNGRGSAYSLMLKKKLENNFANYLTMLKQWDNENNDYSKMCNVMGKNDAKWLNTKSL